MKILYFGKICDEHIFQELEKKKHPYFVAQYMYEKALIDQIKENENIGLDIVSIYQTDYYPNDKFFINKNSSLNKFKYLTYINLPFVREICFFMDSIRRILIWFKNNRKRNDLVILASNHFPPVSLAIVLLGALLGVPRVVTFTDLSNFTYSDKRISKMKWYKKSIIKPYLHMVNYLQRKYDGYVLFSRYMNEIVNEKQKPYCVVEGIYNRDSVNYEDVYKQKDTEKIILHAGTLNREVGIDKILDVFQEITNPNVSLWFIGEGDMSDEIRLKSKKDSRIKHFGFVPKKEVFPILQKATLLVNLRNSADYYTKYSFPSKMFEYMASKTPVFTTRIDGIPEEYYNYVYSVDSYETKILVNRIEEILSKPQGELNAFGNNASKFILQSKTSEYQVDKILRLLQEVLTMK